MTLIPTNWTDGYGTVHAGPPPNGYWIATDDRWYAPQYHPDYVTEATAPLPEAPTHDVGDGGPIDDVNDLAETAPSFGAFDLIETVEAVEAVDQPEQIDTVADSRNWAMPFLDGAPVEPTPNTPAPSPDLSQTTGSPNRTIITALVGVLAILGVIAAVYGLVNRGNDETAGVFTEASNQTPAPVDISTPAEPGSNPTDESTAAPEAVQPAEDDSDLDGIESCTRLDSETLEISMVNVSEATASYLLTVAYLDADGVRVGDDNVYVSSLRPAERTVERSYVFSDAGVGCEVIAADRYDRNGVEGLADISACTIREPNAYGFIEADLSALNSGQSEVDYTVEVALVDVDNVRRGYGTAFVERAPVGTPAPTAVYTTVTYDESYRCEVVAVTRFDSAQ